MSHSANDPYDPAAPSLEAPSTRTGLRRAAASIGAITFGAYGLAATLSYSSEDRSFDVSGDGPIHNLLGAPGANFANLLMQALGAAAPIGMTALLAAGAARLFRQRMIAPISLARLTAGVSGVALLAGAAGCIETANPWGLGAGPGGWLGDGIAHAFTALVRLTGLPWAGGFAGMTALAGGVTAIGWAFRVTGGDVKNAAGFAGKAAAHAGGAAQAAVRKLAERPHAAEPEEEWAPHSARGAEADDAYEAADYAAAAEPYAPPQQYMPPRAEPAGVARPPSGPQPTRARRKAAPAPRQESHRPFHLPGVDLLAPPKQRAAHADGAALQAASKRLSAVLTDFGVQGEVVAARPGPVVTLFEFEPAPGVKSSRVIGLADDIARSMSANAARVAVIPGRNAIGIELPNAKRETVYLRSLLHSSAFIGNQGGLPLALGETIEGEPFSADLAKMPHLLIAGTTGSGKSVGINAMILSLLYRHPPEECKFIMIDPKMLELSVYEGIPHLLSPVVTDPKKAVVALKWTVREMEDRYRSMSKFGVRNIQGYNDRIAQALQRGEPIERTTHAGFDPDSGEPIYETETLPLEPMPYIVVVIDEMADLMLTAGKEIEAAVQRLAQMARAAGIHVIMATQRPSVDVITGTIKANFPTRISYSVTSKIDSRTILGEQGAEQLLGMGDLLFMAGGGRIRRLHGPFVSDSEVERVVAMLKAQGVPAYRSDITEDPDAISEDGAPDFLEGMGVNSGDDLFDRAVEIVRRDKKVSTSYLQRRLQIGYNRAASLVERLEKEGLISPANHAGKREILMGGLSD
ncbi:MAG: DNA translocase FtsK 4TM domain-containing protein [Hyphomonadaceae bacterium]